MPPIAVLVALADPTRCRIIEILGAGPLPVHRIAEEFDISRPAISRHLGVLKQARLISEKKCGRENRYELHARRLKPVHDWLSGLTVVPPHAAKPTASTTGRAPKRRTATKPQAAVTPVLERPAAPAPRPARSSSQMGFDF